MRKIQVGEIVLSVYEGDEIPYTRFAAFKQWLPQIFYSFDLQFFSQTKQKYMDAVSNNRHAEGVVLWENFEQSISLARPNIDAWGMCFALITELKDEKPSVSETELKEKLELLGKIGIKQKQVETEVETFMKALPQIWTFYSALKVRQEQTSKLLSIYG